MAGKFLTFIGGAILALSLISELELEARVGREPAYVTASGARPNLIAVHGRAFYVDDVDYWRSTLVVYVLALGGIIIWFGRGVGTRNW
jgi:hypothetical protein